MERQAFSVTLVEETSGRERNDNFAGEAEQSGRERGPARMGRAASACGDVAEFLAGWLHALSGQKTPAG